MENGPKNFTRTLLILGWRALSPWLYIAGYLSCVVMTFVSLAHGNSSALLWFGGFIGLHLLGWLAERREQRSAPAQP